jgi:outer membrane lipoprotein-sorting protein
MRRRTIALLAAAVAVVVALVVVVTAAAQGPSTLPSITVSQLLNNVATKAQGTTAVSGDVAWTNGLLGGSSLLSLGGTQTPGGLSSLLAGGSGRVWAQGGKVRLESQGQNGDFVVVGNGATVWTWDSMTTTATHYTLPAPTGASTASPAPSPAASLDPATAISQLIAKLAPTATLSVDGQATVAGHQTYTLTLTPTSSITSVGSVTVAIDGQRWVPLQVQVFAKGDTTAVLSAGFKTVSFAPSADSLFTFTPPSGATIVHKTVKAPAFNGMSGNQAAGKTAQHKPLTLAQAKAQAPFLLTPASTPTGVEFRGAFVTPAKGASTATPATGLTPAQSSAVAALGKRPTAVLAYGTGFGTVVVLESQTTAAQDAQIAQGLGQVSMIGKATVNGAPAVRLQTSLGSVVTFRQGDVRVVVAGLVPWSVVDQVAGSLH